MIHIHITGHNLTHTEAIQLLIQTWQHYDIIAVSLKRHTQ